MRVYFDNAATTAISEEVIEAMANCMREHYGNPSSIHAEGRKSRSIIETARKVVAGQLNASLGEIFFTSGGTESSNMAIKCAVRDLGVTRILTTKMEHSCVLYPVKCMATQQNIEMDFIEMDDKGRLDYTQLEKLLQSSDKKTLVSVMHANNEIGTVNDMERISQLCQEYDAFYHSDTVQTMGHFPIDVDKTKIHFLTGAAHKFHGPKGTGFIYINGDCHIKPMIDGGSQERNMRAGTENLYGIVGMAKAFELACNEMEERKNHIENIRQRLINGLKENFEDIQFNGDWDGNYLYTVLSVSFPPSPKISMLLQLLDIHGISCSGGSACSSGAEKGSHVLQAIGHPADRKAIRFSFSHYNTEAEVDFLLDKLKVILPVQEVVI